MAVREIPVEERRQLLAVGDQIEANFDATANEKKIKEIARIVRDFGDLTHVTPNVEHYQNIRERANSRTTWFKQFKDVVDTSLEWLENRGRMYGQKQEQVLRALYNLSELANQAHIFAIMELACACVDAAEDPFPGERQYISQCLEDVKAQQEQIASLVQQASELLKEILQHEGVDYLKGRQFDNVVREAKVQIESCKRRLTGAEEAISKLSKKTGTVKWTKRGVRAGCWGFTSYVLLKRYQESSHSWLDLLQLGGFVVLGGWFSMSFLAGKESTHYESIQKLEADHRMLQEKLEDLHTALKSTKDHRDGL